MRAILLLGVALAFAAYLLVADPFGTPEPERCPGGICPTPEHSVEPAPAPITKASSALSPLVVASPKVPQPPITYSEPVLRAPTPPVAVSPRPESPKILPSGKDGWRIRLFYPRDSKRIANDILAEINTDEDLSNFCNQFGFGSLSTDNPQFDLWHNLGYPSGIISFVMVAPNNQSIYYVHAVPKSARELLSLLQRKMDAYYNVRPQYQWSDWKDTRSDSNTGLIRGRLHR